MYSEERYQLVLYVTRGEKFIKMVLDKVRIGKKRIIVNSLGEKYVELWIPKEISLYTVYEKLHENGIMGEFINVLLEVDNRGRVRDGSDFVETHLRRVKIHQKYGINDIVSAVKTG
mgnify:CR=1 FL=1